MTAWRSARLATRRTRSARTGCSSSGSSRSRPPKAAAGPLGRDHDAGAVGGRQQRPDRRGGQGGQAVERRERPTHPRVRRGDGRPSPARRSCRTEPPWPPGRRTARRSSGPPTASRPATFDRPRGGGDRDCAQPEWHRLRHGRGGRRAALVGLPGEPVADDSQPDRGASAGPSARTASTGHCRGGQGVVRVWAYPAGTADEAVRLGIP